MVKFAIGLVLFMSTALAADLEFLIGKWTASGGGAPGSGQGDFSFERSLNNQIIIRRNFAEYTSGQRHDDLMIIYGGSRAIYFDTEGHTIHYKITTPAPGSAVFESDASQPGPRFRLGYVLEGKSLNGTFEVMEPGKTEYKKYLSWASSKK